MSIPQSTRGGRSVQWKQVSRRVSSVPADKKHVWQPAEPGLRAPPHPPFIHSVSIRPISFLNRAAGQTNDILWCNAAVKRWGAGRGGSAFTPGERGRRGRSGGEDTLLNQSWLRKVIYTLQPAFNSKSGLIITSSGTNNNLSKDHFESFRRPFILQI